MLLFINGANKQRQGTTRPRGNRNRDQTRNQGSRQKGSSMEAGLREAQREGGGAIR